MLNRQIESRLANEPPEEIDVEIRCWSQDHTKQRSHEYGSHAAIDPESQPQKYQAIIQTFAIGSGRITQCLAVLAAHLALGQVVAAVEPELHTT